MLDSAIGLRNFVSCLRQRYDASISYGERENGCSALGICQNLGQRVEKILSLEKRISTHSRGKKFVWMHVAKDPAIH